MVRTLLPTLVRTLSAGGLLMFLVGCATTPTTRVLTQADDRLQSGDPKSAVTFSEQALAGGKLSAAQQVTAHLTAGEGHLALGNFPSATAHFRSASTPYATPQQRGQIARGLGDVRYRQRDYSGALRQYQFTLEQSLTDNERREVNYRLAVCSRYLCNDAEAARYLAKASGYSPSPKDPLRFESAGCAIVSPRRIEPAAEVRAGASPQPAAPWQGSTGSSLLASGGRPQILPRSSWGARPMKGGGAAMGKVKRITIHHTAHSFNSTAEAAAATEIRNDQDYHQRKQGWADLAYHYVIDPAGRVWEGRSIDVQGAHAGSAAANAGNIGVVLLGHFDEEQPTAAAKQSLVDLVTWLRSSYGLPPSAVAGHDEVRKQFTGGGTDCPGRNLAGTVAQLRAGTGVMANARGSAPSRGGKYQVRTGDTLYSIARSQGVEPRELQRANPGVSPEQLRAGAILAIP